MKVWVQEYGGGKMEKEYIDMIAVLESRNILYQTFTRKKIDRKQLPISKDNIVVGEVEVALKALKFLGIEMKANSYPDCLTSFLERNIWKSTIGEIEQQIYNEEITEGVFLKPSLHAKKFTGVVVKSPADLYNFHGASKKTEVYCATPVLWLSEFRVYVHHNSIVGIHHYAGDSNKEIEVSVVENAIESLKVSTENTVAYAIDFGLLSNGKTALIEWNDAFSLGNYGVDKEDYTDMILDRWRELTKNS